MIYRPKAPTVTDGNMTAIEQIFAEKGAAGLVRTIARHLRGPNPHRAILNGVARLLEPLPTDDLALVVVRRTRGNTKTRWVQRAEEIEIAHAVLKFEEDHLSAGKPKRGLRKLARGEIAKRRGISDITVRKAMSRVLRLIPAPK